MTNLEKRSFAQGMSRVLAQPDIEKIMLNLEEMYDLCVYSGTQEELEIIGGLSGKKTQVEELCKRVRKGQGITYERLLEYATYEEPAEE